MQSLRLRRRLKTHYSLYVRDAPDGYGEEGAKSEVDQPASGGPEAVEGGGKGAFVVGFSTPSDPLNPQVRTLRQFGTGLLALTQIL